MEENKHTILNVMYYVRRNSSFPGQVWEGNQLASVRVSCSPVSPPVHPLFIKTWSYYYISKLCMLKHTTGEKQDLPFCPFEKFSYLSHKNVPLETALSIENKLLSEI